MAGLARRSNRRRQAAAEARPGGPGCKTCQVNRSLGVFSYDEHSNFFGGEVISRDLVT